MLNESHKRRVVSHIEADNYNYMELVKIDLWSLQLSQRRVCAISGDRAGGKQTIIEQQLQQQQERTRAKQTRIFDHFIIAGN